MQPESKSKNDCALQFIPPLPSENLSWLKTHNIPICMKAKGTYNKKQAKKKKYLKGISNRRNGE